MLYQVNVPVFADPRPNCLSGLRLPENFPFSKSQRLLVARDFSCVFDKSDYRVSHQYCLILAKSTLGQHNRLGIIVAKKHIRLAASRNRIKRLMRENFRQQQHHLPGIDAIVLARKGLDQLSNPELNSLFKTLWRKIQKQAHSHNP